MNVHLNHYFADAEVPYSVTVKAVNLAGCGEENRTYCFTQEGGKMECLHVDRSDYVSSPFPVPPSPENVIVKQFDSTSIGVSWTKFTLIELKGLANYIVTYNIIIDSKKRQTELGGTMVVPWSQNQVIISGLQPGADYDVTVRTSSSAGMSGSSCNIILLRLSQKLIVLNYNYSPVSSLLPSSLFHIYMYICTRFSLILVHEIYVLCICDCFAAPVGPGDRASITTQPSQTAAAPASSNSDDTVAIIGGVVAVLTVLIVVTAVTILIAIALLRSRRAEFSPNQKYVY